MNAPQPMNPMKIDIAQAENIAFVSTRRGDPGGPPQRWTELAIFYLPDASGRCFIAQVDGVSEFRGEGRRRKRAYVGTVAAAMQLFDEDSDATATVWTMAKDWLDRNPERAKQDVLRLRQLERQPLGGLSFTGQGGLAGALRWLYPDLETESQQSNALERDFGIPARTVRHALRAGELTGWAKGFVSSLLFFDRDRFQAARGRA
jgi:hypothetical protein